MPSDTPTTGLDSLAHTDDHRSLRSDAAGDFLQRDLDATGSLVLRLLWNPGVRALAAGALCIGLWLLVIAVFSPSPILVPSPLRVWSAFRQMLAVGFQGFPLLKHIAVTARRVGLGFGIAVGVGVPVGLAMGRSTLTRSALTPAISLFRPVPPFAWLAILIVWFGIGELPKVLIIFLGSVTLVAVSTMDGVRRVPPQFMEAGVTLGASRTQLFRHVVIPAAAPQIVAGMRAALLLAWTAVIAAEFVAAQAGLGTIILGASAYLRTDQTFVGILLIGACGGVTDWAMGRAQAAIEPWGNR